MVGCVTVRRTQPYVCTLEEFILVDTNSLLYKLELIWHRNYTGIYTSLNRLEKTREVMSWLSDVIELIVHEYGESCS